VLYSEKSGLVGEKTQNGDTSLLQLRDAIDMIIIRLDEKIVEARDGTGDLSQCNSLVVKKKRGGSNDDSAKKMK